MAQLAADGVIEGYGDGTYRGDQAITRFEMAQMVARAMAKGGGQLTFGNKVKATLTVGRSRSYAQVGASPDIADKAGETGLTGSYQADEIYNDRADKWTWGVGFHRWANDALLWPNASTSAVNVWEAGLGYKFDKNLSIHGAYAWTTNPDGEPPEKPGEAAESATSDSERAWSIELDYKGADPADKGSWGAFIAYRHLGQYAVFMPTYDAMGPGCKGMEMGVDYVFTKNVMGTLKYFFGKEFQDENDPDPGDPPQSTSNMLFGELNFFF